MSKEISKDQLYMGIRGVIIEARQLAARSVNTAMVQAYWQIGRMIVEDVQSGNTRANYGEDVLTTIGEQLAGEFGQGFEASNLRKMRQFYQAFPIRDALRLELSWTHYRLVMKVQNPQARAFYIQEAIDSQWSTRQLERQINSFYFERLLASQNTAPVVKEAESQNPPMKVEDLLKDPYVWEFLGLRDFPELSEKELETAIIDNLQLFLLELGRGFSFVARQKRITTETGKHFYIDLVFYNFLLKCFVVIDLKIGGLDHADIGQMDMYVRMYEEKWRQSDDNPTIGIILCSEKDQTIVKYSVLEESKQLFASKYMLYLPTAEELAAELDREIKEIKLLKGL